MGAHEANQAGEGDFSLPLWLTPECCLADGVDGVASAASEREREREREREHPHGRQAERTAVEVEWCCSAASAECMETYCRVRTACAEHGGCGGGCLVGSQCVCVDRMQRLSSDDASEGAHSSDAWAEWSSRR